MPEQSPKARKTIGKDPLDMLVGEGPALLDDEGPKEREDGGQKPPRKQQRAPKQEPIRETKEKLTVVLHSGLLERLKNTAYWKRKTLASLVEEGVKFVVERAEKEHGGVFKKRNEELTPGRPMNG